MIFFPALNRKRLLFKNQLQQWWHELSSNQSTLSRIQLSLRLPFSLYLLAVITYNCLECFYCLVQTSWWTKHSYWLSLELSLSVEVCQNLSFRVHKTHCKRSLLNLTFNLAGGYQDSPRKMLRGLCWSNEEDSNAMLTRKHVLVYTG